MFTFSLSEFNSVVFAMKVFFYVGNLSIALHLLWKLWTKNICISKLKNPGK